MDGALIEFGPGERDMKRELAFSMALLAIYPIPALWALSRLMPARSGSEVWALMGLILAVELASAAGRTAMLRALERTRIRIDERGVLKRVGDAVERMDFAEIARIRVSRSFLFFGIVSLRLRDRGGRRMYVPACGAGPGLLPLLSSLVPAGVISGADGGRYAFALLFAAATAALSSAFVFGFVPAPAVLLAAAFSAALLLAWFPMSDALGRGVRAADRILPAGVAACAIAAGSSMLVFEIAEWAETSAAAAEAFSPGPGRSEAVFRLAGLGNRRAMDALVRLSRSADPDARRDAALALGAWGDGAAAKALDAMLDDADAQVRRFAAWSLGGSMRMKSVPRLLSVLARESEDADVLRAVNSSLERITGETLPASLDSARIEDQDRMTAARFWQQVWNNFVRSGTDGPSKEDGDAGEGE